MFSREQLQDLINGKIVGSRFPYDTGNEREVEAHMRRLFYHINRIPNLICEAEWNHFGSGYASFVQFFCYRKEDVTIVQEKNGMQEVEISGIIIDICRLAPVAIMGEDHRFKKIRIQTNEEVSGGHGMLDSPNRLYVSEKLEAIEKQVNEALRAFDIKRLRPEQLDKPLSLQVKIPTIYREPNQYIEMDAIFYWED
ncbi:hypothetical protein [Alteribacter aurantiacus]|uniref:hypothetical protein n=1 Tax=Alteribacter aurantiacus TaxID=254410 RepID=UPI0003FBCE35|nr:hypothetical protein [Alteribacter aurantiacus]